MFPTECNIPDLSLLQAQSSQSGFLLNQLIGAGNGFPPTLAAYRRNMVRLADKAVRDFTEVRNLVLAQITEGQRPPHEMVKGRQIYMFAAIDRLEDCIITVGRLFRYLNKVKTDPVHFPLNRLLRRQIENVEQSITHTRNLIEHLDDDISGERVPEGQNTAPVLDAATKTISLGAAQLSVETLATAVRHFHEFAHEFAKYRFTSSGQFELMPKSGPLGGIS